MTVERCEMTDLPPAWCSHCRGSTSLRMGEPTPTVDSRPRTAKATRDMKCRNGCGQWIAKGETVFIVNRVWSCGSCHWNNIH